MIKLSVPVEVKQLHHRVQLNVTDLDLVRLTELIVLSELVSQGPKLLRRNEAEGLHFLFDGVCVVDEALERIEFVESDLAIELNLVDVLDVALNLVWRQAHEQALRKVLCADGIAVL